MTNWSKAAQKVYYFRIEFMPSWILVVWALFLGSIFGGKLDLLGFSIF